MTGANDYAGKRLLGQERGATRQAMLPAMGDYPTSLRDGRYAVIAFPFIVVAVAAVVDELLGTLIERMGGG